MNPVPPKIPLIRPDFGSLTPEQWAWVAEHQVPAPNRVIGKFEELMASHFGRSVLATSSGTASLHLALHLAGVGPGDRVICADFTFVATLNSVQYCGATPIIVDVDPNHWGMDLALLEEALQDLARQGKPAKAVLVTHAFGTPMQIDRIATLCRSHGVCLIEDAAGGLGSSYQGKPLGTFGDFGIISFNYNKIISTGGGGALLCREPSDAARARKLAAQAKEPLPYYQHQEVGFNYRINGFGAGVGVYLWAELARRQQGKQAVFERYQQAWAQSGLDWQAQAIPEGGVSNRWLNAFLTADAQQRDEAMSRLASNQIEAGYLWNPMSRQPLYQECQYIGRGVAQYLFDVGVTLPSDHDLSTESQQTVINRILELQTQDKLVERPG